MKSKHIITMSSRKLLQQVFGLTLVVLLLAGCGRAPAGPTITSTPTPPTATPMSIPPTATSTLEGTEWVLISLNGESLIEGTNITLNFAACTELSRSEGILSGFAGCNAYGGGPDSGKYMVTDEGTLTIPQIAVTAMLCSGPEGVMEQEDAYIETLHNAAAYRVMDDRLEIDNAAGETTLVFARKEEFPMKPSDLLGTRWQLLSWNGSSPIAGSTITIAFAEGEISGHAGCRGYRGTYEASGDDIRFPRLSMTEFLCLCPKALIVQEGQYTTSLGWTTNYRLGEESALSLPKGRLEILTARGEVLVFEPLPEGADTSQAKTTWVLTTFIEGGTTTALLAGTEVTVTFEEEAGLASADGTVSGSAGCNTYSAAYTFDGSFLTFEAPSATEMACSDPAGVMEQEQRYLGFLGDITTYHINGNQLRLETGAGRALVFTAQE
jgi:heat shock protein HslJ